ncbi:hypothetical protein TSUD_90640 [Trifolium subterraneum]|uniref:Inhibitor I9 domain-containing protein n=1 Tax=Trifolium subterraneum TaxID=3900 RepID=A0A2Z6NYM0_TRISU|nr:hypothetical protein TSUD_90640 [Trifolium subterraneum]
MNKSAARNSILYSYKNGFSGFAAVLSQSQAKLIADFPGVVRVIPNKILSLHTTRSWDFLRVKQDIVTGVLSRAQSGRGTIIGIIDTGTWPESDSFRDDHMDNPPPRWRGAGSLNATLAKGKAILCFQSRSQRSATTAVRTVMEVEGVGLIYAQFPTKDFDMSWDIPSVQVDFIAGTTILSYMEATR